MQINKYLQVPVGFGKISDAKSGNADDADGADKKRIKKG